MTNITNLDFYMDGGTAKISIKGFGDFYLDRRLRVSSGNLYDRYPEEPGASIIRDRKLKLELASNLRLLLEDEEVQNNLFIYNEDLIINLISEVHALLSDEDIIELEEIVNSRRGISTDS